jgi:integrase/recombinase XerD
MNLKLSVKATKLGIRVRKVTNASQGEKYGHSWLVTVPGRVTGGQRVRKQFKGSEGREAVDFAEGQANLAKETGHSGFNLTVEQRVEAESAFRKLAPLGLSLREVVDCGITVLRPAGGDISFGKLRDDLIEEKRLKNRRPASLQGLRFYLNAIVGHFGQDTLVKTASAVSLREWISSLQQQGASPRHLRNYVSYSKQFFRYAHAHRFIGENPSLLLEAPHVEVKAPAILSILEVRRLLTTCMADAHRDLMPSVVLALFCGLRSEELARLKWDDVNLKSRKVSISPEIGKNRRASDWRYPEIPKGAIQFLLLHEDRKGSITPKRFRARLTALHSDAGFEKWKESHPNAKRHSFGSYACKLKSIDWVIDQMGNSVRMFLKHYRNANVTKSDAGKYFQIKPTNLHAT